VLDSRRRSSDWYEVELPDVRTGLRLSGFVAVEQVERMPDPLSAPTTEKVIVAGQRAIILDGLARTVGAIDIESRAVERVPFSLEFIPRRGPFDLAPATGQGFRVGDFLGSSGREAETEDRGAPAQMVVSPDGSRIVVLDHGPGELRAQSGWRPSRRSVLLVLDASSHEQIAAIQGVWGRPTLHHISEDGMLVLFGPGYRSSRADEARPVELLHVDLRTGTATARFDVGPLVGRQLPADEWARLSALSADGRYLYVLDRGRPSNGATTHVNGHIVVVSTATGKQVATLPAGSAPREFIPDPAGDRLLVLSDHPPHVRDVERRHGELRVVTGDSIAATIPVVADPRFLRFSPDHGHIYVFSPAALTHVDAISLRTADSVRIDRAGPTWGTLGTIFYPGRRGTVTDARISHDGTRAYVLHADSSQLSILDLDRRTRVRTITTGRRSVKIARAIVAAALSAFSEYGARQAAIASGQSHYFYPVYFVLPAQTGLAMRGDGRFAYVLNTQSEDVTVIDTEAGKVVRHLPIAGDALHVMPGGELLGVGRRDSMRFIDMGTNLERKELGFRGQHFAATLSPDGSQLWVLSSRQVSVVDSRTGRLQTTFSQFRAPTQIAFRSGLPPLAVRASAGGAAAGQGISGGDQIAPRANRWLVWHLHASSFCAGWLYVDGSRLGFRSTPDEPHSFEVSLESVREIRSNRVLGGGGTLGAFHVELASGANYNFSSANSRDDGLLQMLEEILRAHRREHAKPVP
jgi:DNA-binding beta-propeller fold protein YncE